MITSQGELLIYLLIAFIPIISLIFVIADIVLTIIILKKGGKEINPFNRFFMEKLGKWWGIPKFIISVAVIAMCVYFGLVIPLCAFTIVTMGVIVSNAIVLRKIK